MHLGNGPGFMVLQKLETLNQSCKVGQKLYCVHAAVCDATLTHKHEIRSGKDGGTEQWVGGRERQSRGNRCGRRLRRIRVHYVEIENNQ